MSIRVNKLSEVDWQPWEGEGYSDAYTDMMIEKTSVSAVSTRLIRLEAGGCTQTHSHNRVHHVVSLRGEAVLETDIESITLEAFTLAIIPSKVAHRFVNKRETIAILEVINLFK